MQAAGTDKRGQGGAKATIESSVEEIDAGTTKVNVSTDYHITGRLARFGRGGMIEEISNRLLREFATNLQTMLAGDWEGAAESAETTTSTTGRDRCTGTPRTSGEQAAVAARRAGAATAPARGREPTSRRPRSTRRPTSRRSRRRAPRANPAIRRTRPRRPTRPMRPGRRGTPAPTRTTTRSRRRCRRRHRRAPPPATPRRHRRRRPRRRPRTSRCRACRWSAACCSVRSSATRSRSPARWCDPGRARDPAPAQRVARRMLGDLTPDMGSESPALESGARRRPRQPRPAGSSKLAAGAIATSPDGLIIGCVR